MFLVVSMWSRGSSTAWNEECLECVLQMCFGNDSEEWLQVILKKFHAARELKNILISRTQWYSMQQRSWKSSSSNRKHLCTIFGISFWLFMTCVCCLKLQLPSNSLKHFETSNFPNAQHVLSMSYAPATFLPIQVCEALQQGLAPNLAHFCAKCILVAIKIGLGAIEFSFGVSWQDQTIGT